MKDFIVTADHLYDGYGAIVQGELIRCKDCKYCTQFRVYKDLWYICTKHEVNIDVKAEDFCSYAERGNNETN